MKCTVTLPVCLVSLLITGGVLVSFCPLERGDIAKTETKTESYAWPPNAV